MLFEAVSGLRVSLFKFEIFLVGAFPNISDLANILECKVCPLPLRYLILPLGASYKVVSICDGVIEKISWLEKDIFFQRGKDCFD